MIEIPRLPVGNTAINLDPNQAVVLYRAICDRLDMSPLGVENMTKEEAHIHRSLGQVEAQLCDLLEFEFPEAV